MSVTAISMRMFKQMYRLKISFALLLVFPIFFLFIFNLAFSGQNITGPSTYGLAIINNDTGVPQDLSEFLEGNGGFPQNWLDDGVGENVSQTVLNLKYPADGERDETSIFNQVNMEYEDIDQAIVNGEISAGVIFPANFSMFILNVINKAIAVDGGILIPGVADINETIIFKGNIEASDFRIARSIVQSVVSGIVDAILLGESVANRVQINTEAVLPQTEDEELNVFDFIAPGIFVFTSILSASLFTAFALDDIEKRTIDRMKLSLVSPKEYIAGFLLLTMVIAIFQIIFLFISSTVIFGFNPVGSFFDAFWIMLILTFPTFGLIFTAAGLFKNTDAAGTSLGMSSSILGFASNAFMPMPDVVIARGLLSFTSGSPDLLLWDLIPWSHGSNALRAILLYNQSLSDVLGDIFMLAIMGLGWMLIGLYIYSNRLYKTNGGA